MILILVSGYFDLASSYSPLYLLQSHHLASINLSSRCFDPLRCQEVQSAHLSLKQISHVRTEYINRKYSITPHHLCPRSRRHPQVHQEALEDLSAKGTWCCSDPRVIGWELEWKTTWGYFEYDLIWQRVWKYCGTPWGREVLDIHRGSKFKLQFEALL